MRDGAPGEAKGIGRGGGGSAEGGFDRREPRIGLGIGGQQVLDGLAQRGIGRAQRREPAQPPGRVELDQLVEGGLDLLPAARIHGATQRSGSPVSSSASQARAERSSRFAVASETPMAAAVSDSDKPPK